MSRPRIARLKRPVKLDKSDLARLSFLGAAQEVTGSQFLLDTRRSRVLFECGMVQGGREARQANSAAFAYRPQELDAVVLTHAHIDHSGLLPRLVKEGYAGPIHCTPGTRDLCRIMLPDSAWIQQHDAERASRQSRRRGGKPVQPLYAPEDAERTLELMRPQAMDQRVQVSEDVEVRFRHTAHILGAASIEVWIRDEVSHRKLLFSGDIGRAEEILLRRPDALEPAELVVMESTYGDRNHRDLEQTLDEFVGLLNDADERRANVIIPVFAVGRAQDILHTLRDFESQGRIRPRKVFLDSPMAINVTDLYKRNLPCLEHEALRRAECEPDFLQPSQLSYTHTREESMAINDERGVIILAASGMCEGGRVMHHLKHQLWRDGTHVMFVGFQAQGTLGRQIVDGKQRVRIFGQEVAVRAKVDTVGGFSAHADQSELLDWYAQFGKPRPALAFVHGEDDRQEILAGKVRARFGVDAMRPELGDWINIPRSGRRFELHAAPRKGRKPVGARR